MEDITLIMTTWNAFDHVKFTIESLYANTVNFKLIIFDNGSKKEVVEFLKDLEKIKNNIRVIYSPENVGVWQSRHNAAKLVDTELMGIIDSDIAFQPNWLLLLSEYFKDKSVGQVGPMKLFGHLNHPYLNKPMHLAWRDIEKETLSLDSKLSKYLGGKSFDGFLNDLIQNNNKFSEQIEVPPHCISGCCMLTRTALFLNPTVVDPEYARSKYGFEDMDYSWTLNELGYKIIISSKVYIHHFEHSSVEENKLDINAPDQQYNTLHFYTKWENRIIKWIEAQRNIGVSMEEIKKSFIISILDKTIPNQIPSKLMQILNYE